MTPKGLVLCAGILLLCGCGQKNLPESLPADELYERAVKELEESDTQKAIDLFQRIIYEFPGSEYIELSRLGLAEAYYEGEDYLLAANEYERFSNEFAMSRHADKALFLAAHAHEKVTENYPLDQTETRKAIELYERVDLRFPSSTYADSAAVRSYFLRDRLARKAFENGYFYYKRKFYDSAIIYFETMIEEFRQTSWLAPAYYYLAESYDMLNLPEDARRARMRLLEEYPLTLEAREVREKHHDLAPEEESTGSVTEKGGVE
jgi:outer membrane protein assembly factor BamD